MRLNRKGMLALMAGILVFAVGFLFLYEFKKQINLEYPAMEYRVGEPTSGEATSIKIKGTLSRPLFRDNSFQGEIIIDKYDFTKTYNLMEIIFYENIRNGYGMMSYDHIDNGKLDLQIFGSIWISGDFDQLIILPAEPVGAESAQSTNFRISAPAKNYEESMKINEELFSY